MAKAILEFETKWLYSNKGRKKSLNKFLNWSLGIFVEVFPGKDNCVRVVKVRTKYDTLICSIAIICSLPPEDGNPVVKTMVSDPNENFQWF